ncbi:extracellular solute-binding protein [Enterococcus sp. HY326]|uniref:extracellular solute-binding protein n=1 Tax=Enterococcus sp. HY326 TaxID=2971265 RepID=UPI00223EAD36|nr:extracellular solute-binding protein [Enterococcus sp. HY326]
MKANKVTFGVFAASAALLLGACGGSNDSTADSTASSEIATEVSEGTTVTFWHAMNGAQEEELVSLTQEFMDANPNITIELQNQSQYSDLQAKINSTLPSPKDLPTITQAYPGWLYSAATDGMLVDLQDYIDNTDIGWGDQEAIREPLMEGAQIDGTQYGIPFNKSTEMLFYNADMLAEYGVEVPTTFEELAEASKTIYEQSNGEVVGAGFDSLNNYYAIGMENAGVDFNADLDFAGDESKEVINYYADGVKEGYFRIAGSDSYLSGPFANEQVAMFIGSIAGEGYVKKDTEGVFEYGVATRPAEMNLQQGTDIYMFDSASSEERTAAFEYMKFLTSPESQLDWAVNTGYMPVVESVLTSTEYLDNPETKVPAELGQATAHLFSIPVAQSSDAAYNETRAIMENILSNTDQDTDQLIEDSVSQFQDAWNQ